jgi:HSP20 family protein
MTTGRHHPLNELIQLQERMNRMLGDLGIHGHGREDFSPGTWTPPVDIYETEGELVLLMDLPDVRSGDVSITVEDSLLVLSGERRPEGAAPRSGHHRQERPMGRFNRSFTLPGTVDRENIRATFRDGVLRIVLPRKPESSPREVRIDIG